MASSQLNPYLLVALGGAFGSALRYHASVLLGARPFTTFAVNVSGSFLIGLLAALTLNAKVRLLLGAGILGGFTTFSAMQLESLAASKAKGFPVELLGILLGSLAFGYLACWSGYAVGAKLR